MPPKNWKQLYDAVLDMRAKTLAPVDVIGCHMLGDRKNANPEVYRFQTLLSLMLSAQTRDQCTAQAMHQLRHSKEGCTPHGILKMSLGDVKDKISMVCFFNRKAEFIQKVSKIIIDEHKGVVPKAIDELVKLPGVGPKMAHIFKECADGEVTGIGVDVHVHRIAQRFDWVPKTVKTPEDTRVALEEWLPKKHWGEINEILVGFGQMVCLPRFPRCGECSAAKYCPNAFKEQSPKQKSEQLLTKRYSSSSSLVRRSSNKSSSKAESGSDGEDDDDEPTLDRQLSYQSQMEKLRAQYGPPPVKREWHRAQTNVVTVVDMEDIGKPRASPTTPLSQRKLSSKKKETSSDSSSSSSESSEDEEESTSTGKKKKQKQTPSNKAKPKGKTSLNGLGRKRTHE